MTNNGIFSIDGSFVEELRNRLLKPNLFGFKFQDSEIPSVEQMGKIISTALWASTQHEEGRRTRFRIAFGEPFILDHLALIFESHKPLSVEEIRRIAPAVVQPEGHIGIWPTGEHGELQI
jgi:hypothetical protein